MTHAVSRRACRGALYAILRHGGAAPAFARRVARGAHCCHVGGCYRDQWQAWRMRRQQRRRG